MVNLAYVPLAIIATIIPLATAANCRGGFAYCGKTLLEKGNIQFQALSDLYIDPLPNIRVGKYGDLIADKLKEANQPLERVYIEDSVFNCVGNDGDIQYEASCPVGCVNAGWGKNDHCVIIPKLIPLPFIPPPRDPRSPKMPQIPASHGARGA